MKSAIKRFSNGLCCAVLFTMVAEGHFWSIAHTSPNDWRIDPLSLYPDLEVRCPEQNSLHPCPDSSEGSVAGSSSNIH